jgi:hypothetical protein
VFYGVKCSEWHVAAVNEEVQGADCAGLRVETREKNAENHENRTI